MWEGNFGAVTNMVKADVHKHWMIQLFVGNSKNLEINVNDQKIHCRAIVVNMNTKHMFSSGNLIHFTMLINPTTQLGRTMRVHFLNEKPYYILCEDIAVELQKRLTSAISRGESRLSHLFKEETGIPLKSYIVLHKLLRAYENIFDGESITAAAIAAGFDSAAHLAFTNKKMTGMSARGIMKESRFLKVIL